MSWFPSRPPIQVDANDFAFKHWFQQIFRFAIGETHAAQVKTIDFIPDEDFLYLVDATAGNITVTLPAASRYGYKKYAIKKIDSTSHTVTIARDGSDTIDGATSLVLSTQYDWGILFSDAVTSWYKISSSSSSSTASTLKSQVYTTGSGNWAVPSGVSAVWLTMIGAGAGGAGATGVGTGASGGGSGELCSGLLVPVTASGTVAYSVGAKGTGGVGANGTAGGDTSFGVYFALGAQSGSRFPRGGGSGGGTLPAGTSSIGNMGSAESVNFFGGSAGGSGAAAGATNVGGVGGAAGGYLGGGAGGTSDATRGGGGGGAASIFGNGGAGGNFTANGTSAASTSYGAGGGGGGSKSGGTTGGDGCGGYIEISWVG